MVQAQKPAILSELSGAYVDVEGIKTFYVKSGKGRPLVLCHGGAPGACTTVSWSPVVERFAAAGFAVYAYDQPGYGHTENPSDFSLAFRAAHAEAFIKKMGLDRFHILGNSQGAYIAAAAALNVPGGDRLVVVNSGTLSPPLDTSEAHAAVRRHGEKLRAYTPTLENARSLTSGTIWGAVPEELAQARYEMSTGRRYEAQRKRADAAPPPPLYDELHRLRGRTLIVWGYNDRANPLERASGLLEKIPGAELHVFDQAAHWPQWDQPERFVRVVTDFLSS